jgi:hypothetical protein
LNGTQQDATRATLVSRELIGGPFDGLWHPMDAFVRRLEIGDGKRVHTYAPDADRCEWNYAGLRTD